MNLTERSTNTTRKAHKEGRRLLLNAGTSMLSALSAWTAGSSGH